MRLKSPHDPPHTTKRHRTPHHPCGCYFCTGSAKKKYHNTRARKKYTMKKLEEEMEAVMPLAEQCNSCKWKDYKYENKTSIPSCMHGGHGLWAYTKYVNPNNDCQYFEEEDNG